MLNLCHWFWYSTWRCSWDTCWWCPFDYQILPHVRIRLITTESRAYNQVVRDVHVRKGVAPIISPNPDPPPSTLPSPISFQNPSITANLSFQTSPIIKYIQHLPLPLWIQGSAENLICNIYAGRRRTCMISRRFEEERLYWEHTCSPTTTFLQT